MGIKTKIEYCDSTINPTPVCSGCELYSSDPVRNHCYAATLVNRYKGLKGWPNSFTEFTLFEERIPQACNWPDLTGQERPGKPWLNGYPRIIFLNDLGDGFAPIAPRGWILPYIGMMEASPHIWLLLTKWPLRMVEFFRVLGYVPNNFWLGTTVTGQDTAWRTVELARLGKLTSTLWISLEPLIKPVNFKTGRFDAMDWIADGGESGTNARPSHLGWHRSARDFSQANKIKYFFKQHGEWIQQETVPGDNWSQVTWMDKAGITHEPGEAATFWRVGKSRAGRLLDGVEWNEMPEVKR